MRNTLENRFYYLENFETVLGWIASRYGDLLTGEECAFIERFGALPAPSKALLVRMVMRKGSLFRASKLRYDEIGCARDAAQPLTALGWIDDQPLLTLQQLFGLLTRAELTAIFGPALRQAGATKAAQLEALRAAFPDTLAFSAWHGAAVDCRDCVYQVTVGDLCDRLRLMFFGNLRQDWSEFVLSDLGIFRYEKVELSVSSRGFRTRRDVDDYLHLHACRERFEQGEPGDAIAADIRARASDNDWLQSRRGRLLFQIAQHYEKAGEYDKALELYAECGYPGARLRAVRVLERSGQFTAAFELAGIARKMPESEAETQQLARILPRLQRKLNLPITRAGAPMPVATLDLSLPRPDAPFFVEELVRAHLEEDHAPAYYVENTLINSLFGLLCWQAVFAPLPGAFFHPFHAGPADLHSADFHQRRKAAFDACLSELDSQQYRHTILRNFRDKAGIQSPFVFWEALSETLLRHALDCIPATHLKKWFERILPDIRANRSGLPDLIQFWPQQRRYRMIEVKGPGDRLQDNQVRWLDYCAAHHMPVAVCYVQWQESAE